MYQIQQKSTENITVTVPKTTEKHRKHYSSSVNVPNTTKKYRKVPKTTEKYRKHHSNMPNNSTKVLKTLQ